MTFHTNMAFQTLSVASTILFALPSAHAAEVYADPTFLVGSLLGLLALFVTALLLILARRYRNLKLLYSQLQSRLEDSGNCTNCGDRLRLLSKPGACVYSEVNKLTPARNQITIQSHATTTTTTTTPATLTSNSKQTSQSQERNREEAYSSTQALPPYQPIRHSRPQRQRSSDFGQDRTERPMLAFALNRQTQSLQTSPKASRKFGYFRHEMGKRHASLSALDSNGQPIHNDSYLTKSHRHHQVPFTRPKYFPPPQGPRLDFGTQQSRPSAGGMTHEIRQRMDLLGGQESSVGDHTTNNDEDYPSVFEGATGFDAATLENGLPLLPYSPTRRKHVPREVQRTMESKPDLITDHTEPFLWMKAVAGGSVHRAPSAESAIPLTHLKDTALPSNPNMTKHSGALSFGESTAKADHQTSPKKSTDGTSSPFFVPQHTNFPTLLRSALDKQEDEGDDHQQTAPSQGKHGHLPSRNLASGRNSDLVSLDGGSGYDTQMSDVGMLSADEQSVAGTPRGSNDHRKKPIIPPALQRQQYVYYEGETSQMDSDSSSKMLLRIANKKTAPSSEDVSTGDTNQMKGQPQKKLPSASTSAPGSRVHELRMEESGGQKVRFDRAALSHTSVQSNGPISKAGCTLQPQHMRQISGSPSLHSRFAPGTCDVQIRL